MKKKHILTGLLALAVVCSGMAVQKIVNGSAYTETARYEEKIYCNATMEESFDGGCVMVVMDKYISEINKTYEENFFGDIEIERIQDLTYISGDINEKQYLNLESFRQILKIDLPQDSKESVLSAVEVLENIDGILWAGPNYYQSVSGQVSDEYADLQWAIEDLDLERAWDITTGVRTVKVGVIDSGIAAHPDLNENVLEGWDFVNNNITTDDSQGHGTHVAGIIGAVGNNCDGVTGVNWEVSLVPLQAAILTSDAEGNPLWRISGAAVASAISWAIEQNIPLLNFSIGFNTVSSAMRLAVENYSGLLVCAAGNSSTDNDVTPVYFADYADETNSEYSDFSNRIISVGALSSESERSSFSNYGTNSVSIYAPGTSIASTFPDGYCYMSGTSMAAPYVSGTAALMLSVNPNLTGAQLKGMILESADTITISTPSGAQTVKKLNAYHAVRNANFITDGASITGTYVKPIDELTIPEKINGAIITGIGEEAFSNCSGLTSVVFPSTLRSIGAKAFKGCSNLSEISYSGGSISIGANAFEGCGFTSFTLTEDLESIGAEAFANCTELKVVSIDSDTVIESGEDVFKDCDNLELIDIPNSTIMAAYRDDWAWSQYSDIMHCLGLDCVLITDDRSGVWQKYFSTYEFLDIYITQSEIDYEQVQNIVEESSASGIIFYATTVEFLRYTQQAYEYGDIPCATVTYLPNDVDNDMVFLEDQYSAGFNIATTYVNGLNELGLLETTQETYIQLGYFPVMIPSEAADVSLLMGLSHVLGVPVRPLFDEMLVDDELDVLSELDVSFSRWLFIDIYDMGELYPFNRRSISLQGSYFFGHDDDIKVFQSVSSNTYQIIDKVAYLEEIAVYFDNVQVGRGLELDCYDWKFDAATKWAEMEYTEDGDTDFEDWANIWIQQGCDVYGWGIWCEYWDACWTIGVCGDNWDTYWETYKTCRVEQIVVLL